jgi:hypothetical protein
MVQAGRALAELLAATGGIEVSRDETMLSPFIERRTACAICQVGEACRRGDVSW